MNRYVLLRIQTEPSKEPTTKDEIVVKFFPVKGDDGAPVVLEADSPESALAFVRSRTPHLVHFFAIEPEERYAATVKRLAELSAKRRGGNLGGKSPGTERILAYGQPGLEITHPIG